MKICEMKLAWTHTEMSVSTSASKHACSCQQVRRTCQLVWCVQHVSRCIQHVSSKNTEDVYHFVMDTRHDERQHQRVEIRMFVSAGVSNRSAVGTQHVSRCIQYVA